MTDCVYASAVPGRWHFAKAPANRLAEIRHQGVIPDLVSEERAESVGNPCLDGGEIKTRETTLATRAMGFQQVAGLT
jgi:hypothetical protein